MHIIDREVAGMTRGPGIALAAADLQRMAGLVGGKVGPQGGRRCGH